MATLDAAGYDFLHSFPPPSDANWHRAGRQGMLDQKEDACMGDGDWIAYQHACWTAELRELLKGLRCLHWAESRRIDPRTGRAVRNPQRWPGVRDQALAEARSIEAQLCALLDDYSNHFGPEAADRFGDFVRRTLDAEANQLAQRELF